VIFHCGFDLHFPDDRVMNPSCVPTGHSFIFFEKNVYSDPLPIFKSDYLGFFFFFLLLNCMSSCILMYGDSK